MMIRILNSEYGLIFTRFISLGFNFLFNFILAKSLGANDLGVFYYLISLCTFLSVVTRFGTDSYAIREWSRNEYSALFTPFIYIYILSFLLLLIFVSIVYYIIPLDNHKQIVLFLPFLILNNVLLILAQFSNVIHRHKVGLAISSCLPQLITLIFVISFDMGIDELIKVYLCSMLISCLTLFVLFRKRLNLKIRFLDVFDIILKSFNFYKASLVSAIVVFIPILLLEQFSDPTSIAWYNLSLRISASCAIVFVAMNSYYSPIISRVYNANGIASIRQLYNSVIFKLNCIMQPMLFIAFLLGIYIFNYLGEDYIGAKWVLIVLLMYQSINAFLGFSGTVLNMCGMEKIQKESIYLSLVILLCISPILIYKFNALGGAIAYAIANISGNFRSYIKLRNYWYEKNKYL